VSATNPVAGLFRRFIFPSLAEVFVAGEQVRYYERFHLVYVFVRIWPALVISMVSLVVAASLDPGPAQLGAGLVALGAQAVVYYQLIEWSVTRVVVTDRRLFQVSGFLSLQIDSILVEQLTDFSYRQSFWGRALEFGSVRVESPGQVQSIEHIHYLKQPGEFYQQLGGIVIKGGPAQRARQDMVDELRGLRQDLRRRRP